MALAMFGFEAGASNKVQCVDQWDEIVDLMRKEVAACENRLTPRHKAERTEREIQINGLREEFREDQQLLRNELRDSLHSANTVRIKESQETQARLEDFAGIAVLHRQLIQKLEDRLAELDTKCNCMQKSTHELWQASDGHVQRLAGMETVVVTSGEHAKRLQNLEVTLQRHQTHHEKVPTDLKELAEATAVYAQQLDALQASTAASQDALAQRLRQSEEVSGARLQRLEASVEEHASHAKKLQNFDVNLDAFGFRQAQHDDCQKRHADTATEHSRRLQNLEASLEVQKQLANVSTDHSKRLQCLEANLDRHKTYYEELCIKQRDLAEATPRSAELAQTLRNHRDGLEKTCQDVTKEHKQRLDSFVDSLDASTKASNNHAQRLESLEALHTCLRIDFGTFESNLGWQWKAHKEATENTIAIDEGVQKLLKEASDDHSQRLQDLEANTRALSQEHARRLQCVEGAAQETRISHGQVLQKLEAQARALGEEHSQRLQVLEADQEIGSLLVDLSQRIKKLEAANEEAEASIAQTKRLYDDVCANQQHLAEATPLRTEVGLTLKKHREELEQQIQEGTSIRSELGSTLRMHQESLDKKSDAYHQELLDKIARCNQELSAVNEGLTVLKRENSTSKTEIQQLEAHYVEQSAKHANSVCGRYQAQISGWKDHMEEVRTSISDKINDLQAEVKDIKGRMMVKPEAQDQSGWFNMMSGSVTVR